MADDDEQKQIAACLFFLHPITIFPSFFFTLTLSTSCPCSLYFSLSHLCGLHMKNCTHFQFISTKYIVMQMSRHPHGCEIWLEFISDDVVRCNRKSIDNINSENINQHQTYENGYILLSAHSIFFFSFAIFIGLFARYFWIEFNLVFVADSCGDTQRHFRIIHKSN